MSKKYVLAFQIFSLVLLVTALSWALIAVIGVDVPIHDQWDTEGLFLYPRWLSGTLTWQDLFHPRNEHRIVFTQVLDLFLLWSNKQWDPILQMVVGALIHGAAAGMISCWVAKSCEGRERIAAFTLIALLNFPFLGWQNTIWGFQSQMYFVLLFSFAAFYFITLRPALSLKWWAGVCAALCACFSMAAGTFTALSLLGFAVFRCIEERRIERTSVYTAAAASGLIAIAFTFRTHVSDHDVYRAKSILDFEAIAAARLGWPNVASIFHFIPLNIPLIALVVRRLSRRAPQSLLGDQALLVGLWGAASAISEALLRAQPLDAISSGPPSRYADYLAFIPLANGLACLELLRRSTGPFPGWMRIAVSVWCFLFSVGWLQLSFQVYDTALDDRIADPYGYTFPTTLFAFKNNPSAYQPRSSVHSDLSIIRETLDNQKTSEILPPSLQRGSELSWPEINSGPVRAGASGSLPQTGSYPAWGTFSADGKHRVGRSVSEAFKIGSSAVEFSVFLAARVGLSMRFVDVHSKQIFPVDLDEVQTLSWQNIDVRLKPGLYHLEVESDTPDRWLGFTAPRSMGYWSFWVRRLLKQAGDIVWLAGGLFVVSLYGIKLPRSCDIRSLKNPLPLRNPHC